VATIEVFIPFCDERCSIVDGSFVDMAFKLNSRIGGRMLCRLKF